MARRSPNRADKENVDRIDTCLEKFHLEELITYRLHVLSHMINRQTEQFLQQEFDISLPDWRIVANLGRFQNISVRELSARAQMDKALVSRVVARLVKQGLVHSQPDMNDLRLVVLSLTKTGQAMHKKIMPSAQKRHQDLVDCLDSKTLAIFNHALDQLTDAVTANEPSKPGRM